MNDSTDGESARCSASSRPAQPSTFSRCMLLFTTRSTFNATSSPAALFGSSGPRQHKPGGFRLRRPDRAYHPDHCDRTPVHVTEPAAGPLRSTMEPSAISEQMVTKTFDFGSGQL